MSELDNEYYNFVEFQSLMEQTTANLKRMNKMQDYMRWQFDNPQYWEDFVKELDHTYNGWVSSHC